MALALLELAGLDRGSARFEIDTGTNSFYQLKAGRSVRSNAGIDWIDDVFFATPMARSPAGGQLLEPPKMVSLPLRQLNGSNGGNIYVQLFSFKDLSGRSPGFSSPVLLVHGAGAAGRLLGETMTSISMDSFRAARIVPCRTYGEAYSQAASLEDLLSGILKVAGPALLNLFAGSQNGSKPDGSQAASAAGGGSGGLPAVLASLLKAVLGGLQSGGAGVSTSKSLLPDGSDGNRFLNGKGTLYASPFIFGVDDALIGMLAGPILQALPQMMNAANQQRLGMKQADNKLVTDLLAETNRRLLLEELLRLQANAQAKPAAPAQGSGTADLNALIQLLQQAQATPAAPGGTQPAAPAAPVQAKSLSIEDAAPPAYLSSKAVLTFATKDAIPWNGKEEVLFARNRGIQLKLRLSVAAPAPKLPLPKAIVTIALKDGTDQTVLFEKTFKQKNVSANTELTFQFAPEELAHVPTNRLLSVLGEMRWQTQTSGNERKALGSTELILVNTFFLVAQGSAVSPEKELTDMSRYRPFWNRVWESPVMDAVKERRDDKNYLWELDANGKYSMLLSPDQPSNGLMQTKILRGPVDRESLTERIDGRMKAGIELSMAELNKLCPLWDGAQALGPEKLEAIATRETARSNAAEFIYRFKLKGKAAERGMVWVIPVFKLFEFTLNSVRGVDDAGQVTGVSEEKVRFPLPVSARIIGVKSEQ